MKKNESNMTNKEMVKTFNELTIILTSLNDSDVPNKVKRFGTKVEGARRIDALRKRVDELKSKSKIGRKQQVLAILNTGETTMTFISSHLDISKKNISSILTYLRREGHSIKTHRLGKEHVVQIIE